MSRYVDLRYTGQSYELTIALPDEPDPAARLTALVAAFAREHERSYGHSSVTDPISLVNLRLTAGIRRGEARAPGRAPTVKSDGQADRKAWFGRDVGMLTVPVIGRGDLDINPRHGPFLVDEYDATTLVPPRASARLDEQGDIVIDTVSAR
jgi:N-methylhydantoinase A